ncbi:uncharacterized protein [Physcomitrium patens]|uniref:RNA-polymerase II-associated protein 3-like C-terminal domain-containing protein n=1 Tax=Physcomitrium patens TaxID=3218 RepID=A0A2K1IH72_PHYPA|nr:RNA polymerase II-associated protein 3-like [Physcomitrium patens]PNR28621.1 hypothetical protein PHYPA_029214 [Physcomitrium patens]|eukprot:XP_024364769.1 RNA polymerase II-associated protein 3-like [Physcomitrella patens]
MSYEVQKQIRDNSTELQDFLHDLTQWEHVVKEKEKKLVDSGSKIIPSVRGQKQSSLDEGSVNYDADKKIPRKAASHTYDYFRDKWDKFDVDAALAEVDEEPQPKKSSLKKVAGLNKTKPSNAKAKVEEKPPKSNLSVSESSIYTPSRGSSRASLGTLETLSSSYGLEDQPVPDAMSEKDLGNEYFKERKYVKAIECYSRSIALEPTAVTFANRAMAFLKIRRYADAEADCTEAISLDDRYTKAYSRRGTARKELQKYFPAVEDFEFALRLEPENKELKKQYNEAKGLYEKFASKGKPTQNKVPILVEELSGTSPGMSESTELPSSKISPRATTKYLERNDPYSAKLHPSGTESGASAARRLDERKPASPATSNIIPVATSSLNSFASSSLISGNVPVDRKDPGNNGVANSLSSASSRAASTIKSPATPTESVGSQGASSVNPRSSDDWAVATSKKMDASRPVDDPVPFPLSAQLAKDKVDRKLTAEVKAPSQATVERAAMNARAGLARNMVAPKTSYEFESTWKCFANDRQSQSRLLKIMEPSSLPKIFKDLLGAPLLMDIMGCLPLLLPEHTGLLLRILENLVKVGRFDMTILFLTSKDKTVMRKLWEDILATEELSMNEETKLNALRSKYKL